MPCLSELHSKPTQYFHLFPFISYISWEQLDKKFSHVHLDGYIFSDNCLNHHLLHSFIHSKQIIHDFLPWKKTSDYLRHMMTSCWVERLNWFSYCYMTELIQKLLNDWIDTETALWLNWFRNCFYLHMDLFCVILYNYYLIWHHFWRNQI